MTAIVDLRCHLPGGAGTFAENVTCTAAVMAVSRFSKAGLFRFLHADLLTCVQEPAPTGAPAPATKLVGGGSIGELKVSYNGTEWVIAVHQIFFDNVYLDAFGTIPDC